ncbi:MAG: glycosyltransferase family 4 protein [Chloroflexales bacterium]|nr:glycosyltransferase family 4 protein [Chloroflexales bacterium]
MRIALYNLTTTTAYGGVESFVWDLANQLAMRNHSVTIIGGNGARREENTNVAVVTFPFTHRTWFNRIPGLARAYAERKLFERLSLAWRAIPFLIRGKFDIIHIQKPYDLLPALIAARFSGAKVILGCHGEDFYRGDRWLASRVSGAVSCSKFNAQTIINRYHINVDVIYNGIDTTIFRPTPTPIQLPITPLCVLFVGRLQPWKGVDTAIRAIALTPNTILQIAGDGEQRQALEALVVELKLEHRVTFLGSVPRHTLPAIMYCSHVLVATSFASETFGIGLVEAQSCGLPVIASRVGGFIETVAEGVTGRFFTPKDANDLANQLQFLIENPEMRQQYAAAAPGWAAQFAWPSITDRVTLAYNAALKRG